MKLNIKKRIILTLILTILCLFYTNKYWLIVKPLQIQFDIKGNGVLTLAIILNNKNNEKYTETLDLSKVSKLNFEVQTPLVVRSLKLAFDAGSSTAPPPDFMISAISLREGKYKLDDLANFSSTNATINIKENSLFIIPDKNHFEIIYDKFLKIRPHIKFDFQIFIIITILSFLILYKFMDYLADFKTIKHQPLADIIFVFSFFIILFIPMHKLDNNIYSQQELRKFATYQPLINDNTINYDYGNNLNNYFSDHFFLREIIIRFYDEFKYYIAYKNYVLPKHALLNKKTNWAFRLDPYSTSIYNALSKQDIELIASNLTRFNNFCNSNGIKFYIIVVPSKENIYRDKNDYLPNNRNENFNDVYNYIIQNTNLNIIFPSKEFKAEAEKNFIFYKTDHHWTDYAAFRGYTMLAKKIKKDFPDFVSEDISNFNITKNKLVRCDFLRTFTTGQTLHAFLNLNSKKIAEHVLDVEYPYYEHKMQDKLQVIQSLRHMTKDFYFPAKNNLTAIELGNSMAENFNGFLPYSFKHLKYYRINNKYRAFVDELKISNYEKEILEIKPDILIITIGSGHITPLKNMYEREN